MLRAVSTTTVYQLSLAVNIIVATYAIQADDHHRVKINTANHRAVKIDK
jgi:hypothetical protein